jgi:hypothetical protein
MAARSCGFPLRARRLLAGRTGWSREATGSGGQAPWTLMPVEGRTYSLIPNLRGAEVTSSVPLSSEA